MRVRSSVPGFSARVRRGFTLIELMVLLFCMVVAAAMVIPRLGSFQRSSQARDTARKMAALVREGRILAIEQQRPVVMSIDSQNHRAGLQYDDTLLPQDDTATTGQGSTQSRSSGSLNSNGSTTSSMGGQGSAGASLPIVFFPDAIQAELQASDPSDSSVSGSGLTFMPDGRASDADVIVAYDAAHSLQVSVRRQATQIRIEAAGAPTAQGRNNST